MHTFQARSFPVRVIRKWLTTLAALCTLGTMSTVYAEEENPVAEELLEMMGVVEDKDGFVNVRSEASTEGKVVGKVNSGAVIGIEATHGDWATISDDTGTGRKLFVHASRLKKLTGWKQTEGVAGEDSASAKVGELTVKVKAVPFSKKEHKITKDKDGMELVDGHTVWGMDGGIPDTGLSVSVKIGGKAADIPADAMRDLYQPNFDSLVVLTKDDSAKHALVLMTNSDGAGGYCVVWTFLDGKYIGRTVFVPF